MDFVVAKQGSRIGTELYGGYVVFGVDAIYIFKQPIRVVGHGVLGAMAIAADAIVQRVGTSPDLAGVEYAVLPEQVRKDPKWPVFRSPPDYPIVVVQKESVQAIRHKWGAHELNLQVDGVDVAIKYGDFRGGRIKRFLIEHGWPLFWNGVPWNLTSTVAGSLPKSPVPRMALICFGTAIVLMAVGVGFLMAPGWVQTRFQLLYGAAFFGAPVAFVFGALSLRRNK